ncbi:MAG: ABC transporter permease [Rubrobacter sp.]
MKRDGLENVSPEGSAGASGAVDDDRAGELGQVAGRTQREIIWRRFRKHRLAMVCGVILLLLYLLALAAPLIAPYDYDAIDYTALSAGPTAAHPFGADSLGRDQLTRVLYGGRVSLVAGLSVGLFSTLIGAAVGIFSGFTGGRIDTFSVGFLDFMLTLPLLPFLLVLGSVFNFTAVTISFVLVLLLWPSIARVVRSQVLSLRSQEYVQAAKAIGVSNATTMVRHVLPNVVGVMVVQATLVTADAILLESALSFLGLGIQPPTPSWGNLLEDARTTLTQAWWLTVFPAAMIIITAVCVNFLGDGLRDALDPKAVE